ncbi:MAG: hypothetical protein JNM86_04985 [Phycisphaerae bacterium]|nr:hypothetical protein [Phycisphaerae bacterium]
MTVDTRYFALGVRIVGIFVLARAIPDSVYQVLGFVQLFFPKNAAAGALDDFVWGWGPTIVYQVVELGIGFYLLMGGGAMARWCIRSCEFNCPRCGYDLQNIKADRCPECGSKNVLLAAAGVGSDTDSVH